MSQLVSLPRPLEKGIVVKLGAAKGMHLLTKGDEAEALSFLSTRPIATAIMAGFIRDHGLENELNRGRFYAYRNGVGRIEGIALVGHATLFETRSEAARHGLAQLFHQSENVRMIMGEQGNVESLWRQYVKVAMLSAAARRILFEQRWAMLELRWPVEVKLSVRGLRLATANDLDVVMTTHARMAVEEFGLDDPLAIDPVGFRRRCAQRVQQGRVWVLFEDGSLVFKADVVSDTAEAIYLEGIYVAPDRRRQGYGSRCISQLSRDLLSRANSICLLVNEQNWSARTFYQRAGFRFQSSYQTIYLA